MHLHRPCMAAKRPDFSADSQRFNSDSQLPNTVQGEQLLEYWQYSCGTLMPKYSVCPP